MEQFSVRLHKQSLVFSAAHFITYAGGVCERIHGHNYGVSVEARAPLDENHYVVDFILLRDAVAAIVQEWDHHVLLPTEHPTIRVSSDGREVTAEFEQRRWVFPADDCVLLPVANTTAERLAECLGRRLLAELAPRFTPRSLRVEVDENRGQWGGWEHSVDAE